ncbi:type II toxin-antitoxin system HipA family toxin [Sulfurimonas sp.]|uniref:type II toxin-antitoxin system HipA family toxin n=1 Tax=Sulfurimonas sp. TaxID=2022749 RepID=UPI003561F90D
MQDNLKVKVHNKTVGNLVYENEDYIFSYNSSDKDDFVSLTMQVRVRDYLNRQLHPLFEMHLPEGYLLSVIKKHYSKLTKTDDFGLLSLMSSKVKGRISYENSASTNQEVLTLDTLLHPENENLFEELVDRFALSSAISGVQPKVLAKVQDKATLSFDEYIVKSWGDDYPHLALNEYYSMQIVKHANIEVPEFYISDDNKLFIMKRFDIKDDGSFLGFEDMCVLQARPRDDKYEGSYEQIAKTIKTFVSPKNKKDSLEQYFKMIVINNLVKNGDAHLKNFGLIYEDINDIKLSPAFDIVCTTIYIKNDVPALHLLGSKKWWDKKYLIKFGVESCELTPKDANSLYDTCVEAFDFICKEINERIEKEEDAEIKEFLSQLFK